VQVEFSVSGVTVHPLVPPLVAFVISFFTSMGGVSGAFLLLPFQMSVLGFTSPSVSATNQLYNVVAIPSGVLRYIREGRMVWPLTWIVIAGTLPGVLIGVIARVRWLPDPQSFKLFAGLVLLYIGVRLARQVVGRGQSGVNRDNAEERFQSLVAAHDRRVEADTAAGREEIPKVAVRHFGLGRIEYEFYGEVYEFPTFGIFALSLVVGVVGGVYGIGGGAIMAPFFVTVCRLPVYTVAGAALMGTLITSFAGVVFYQAIAPFYPDLAVAPDWALGVLFGLGGAAGMYLGARTQKFVPALAIKAMLGLVVLFTAAKYIVGFFQ
jgi:uncharacterized membrane protein YfcA